MDLKKIEPRDEEQFLAMEDDFYHSGAVMAPIPRDNARRTFSLLMTGSPFAAARIIQLEGKTAGYILLAFTWSNEAGGMVVWLEELYIRPEFRGKGLGREAIRRVMAHYQGKAARFRLEVESSNTRAKKLYRKIGFTDLPYGQMYIES